MKKVYVMAAPKLTIEQRDALLTWLAADYSEPLIHKWFLDREWEPLSQAGVSYYRKKFAAEIEAARKERRDSALSTGLALKEERIKRLVEHADELEAIKWIPDDKGRLWNEKAWRETLDDIAKETGGRRVVSVNQNWDMTAFSDDELARIAAGTDPAVVVGDRKL